LPGIVVLLLLDGVAESRKVRVNHLSPVQLNISWTVLLEVTAEATRCEHLLAKSNSGEFGKL